MHAKMTARTFVRRALLASSFGPVLLALSPGHALAQTAASQVGDTITNPVTGLSTTVSALILDPAGTPTAGNTAFVRTADGYTFLVKTVGQTIYNRDTPPIGFIIASVDNTAHTVTLDALPAGGPTAPLDQRMTNADYELNF